MRMLSKAMAVIMFVVLVSAPVFAEEKGNLNLTSVSEVDTVVVNAKGEKEVKRVDAAKAKVVPGDTVIFTTLYRNIGKEPVTNAVITNPTPEHTLYVDKSAEGKGARIEFSVDNGKTYDAAKNLTVLDAKGKARPAAATDYTHIRWTLGKPLAPGAKGSVSFKAKIK